MSDIPVNTLIPAGVIIASTIAGVFSFVSLVLSKEQKVSEFRQQWIDSLRDDISDFIGNVVVLAEMKLKNRINKQVNNRPEFSSSEIKDCQTATSIAYTNIILRLNPSDKSIFVNNLIKHLDEVRDFASEGKWNDINGKIDNVRDDSQKLLKEEWDRVRRGEPIFVWSKRFALITFISTFIFGGHFIYKFISG